MNEKTTSLIRKERIWTMDMDTESNTQQSNTQRDVKPMLGWCCPIVYDAGPTSTQHWFNVPCMLSLVLDGCHQDRSLTSTSFNEINSPETHLHTISLTFSKQKFHKIRNIT